MTVKSLNEVSEYPLCWPESKPRAAKREQFAYSTTGAKMKWNATMAAARQQIEDEMRRMGVNDDYVISMSPRHKLGSPDPGVAVWWNDPWKNGADMLRVIACDAYLDPAVNLYAIGLTLNRLRLVECYGAYSLEQAMEGARPALPPPPDQATLDWKVVLGAVPPGVTGDDAVAIVNARYRRLSAEAQGNENEQRRLNLAIQAARDELRTR